MPQLTINYIQDAEVMMLDFIQDDTKAELKVGIMSNGTQVDIPPESMTDVLSMMHDVVTQTMLNIASELESRNNPETSELILPPKRSMTLTDDAGSEGIYLPAEVVTEVDKAT